MQDTDNPQTEEIKVAEVIEKTKTAETDENESQTTPIKVEATLDGVKAEQPPLKKEKKVLVVDDSKPIRRMLEKVLHSEGFEVGLADNGKSAIRKITDSEKPYDLMILDLMMPVMDGIEMLEYAKNNSDKVTIPKTLICSCKSDRDSVVIAKNLGIAGYVLKPFKTDILLQKVQELIAEDN